VHFHLLLEHGFCSDGEVGLEADAEAGAAASVTSLPREQAFMAKRLISRQVSQGLYSSVANSLAAMLINLPFQFVATIFFGTILYFFASYAQSWRPLGVLEFGFYFFMRSR